MTVMNDLLTAYVAREQRKTAEALKNPAGQVQRELDSPSYPSNTQADPGKNAPAATSAPMSVMGVKIDQRVLIGTGVVIAALLAYKAFK